MGSRQLRPHGFGNESPGRHAGLHLLTSDGKISGSGGCNRYFGGWGFLEGTKDAIRIWRTGSTKMACQEPVMTQEYGYLEELTRISSYSMEGRELRLYYNEGRGVLRFTRGAP